MSEEVKATQKTQHETMDYTPLTLKAWRCMQQYGSTVSLVMLTHVILRILVFAPWLISAVFNRSLPDTLCWGFALFVIVFLIIPLRFWEGEKLRRTFYTHHSSSSKSRPYVKWLKAGLLRWLHSLLWGIPFLFFSGYFFLYGKDLPFTDKWQPVLSLLSGLIGKEPSIEYAWPTAIVLLAVTGALFAFGWWRKMPIEYLPARVLDLKTLFHWTRSIRRKHRKQMIKCTWVNMLYTLPAIAGVILVIFFYLQPKLPSGISLATAFEVIFRQLRRPLPLKQTVQLIAVALLIYLPLWNIRKLRNAALVARYMRMRSSHRHTESDSDHAVG